MMMDIASLLNHSSDSVDLVEAFCSHDSMLTKVARQAGLKCERWTIDDFDLTTEEGYDQAEARLRELKPGESGFLQNVVRFHSSRMRIKEPRNRLRI